MGQSEGSRKLWDQATTKRNNPARVRQSPNPCRVVCLWNNWSQGSRKLEPWAEISQRLRRILPTPSAYFKVNQEARVAPYRCSDFFTVGGAVGTFTACSPFVVPSCASRSGTFSPNACNCCRSA